VINIVLLVYLFQITNLTNLKHTLKLTNLVSGLDTLVGSLIQTGLHLLKPFTRNAVSCQTMLFTILLVTPSLVLQH